MACSEAQRIIGLSLNKIIASRSRRGGISLHRNLLVASVLLKARDIYVADTMAANKVKVVDDEPAPVLTIRLNGGSQEIATELEQSIENPDLCDDSLSGEEHMDINDSQYAPLTSSTDDELLDVRFEERVLLVLPMPVPEGDESVPLHLCTVDHSDRTDEDSDVDADQSKENVAPAESDSEVRHIDGDVKPSSEINRRGAAYHQRKRIYSELDRAVVSIGGQTDTSLGDVGNRNNVNSVCCDIAYHSEPVNKKPRLEVAAYSIERAPTSDRLRLNSEGSTMRSNTKQYRFASRGSGCPNEALDDAFKVCAPTSALLVATI